MPEPASASAPATVARVVGFPAPVGPLDLQLHVGDVVHVTGPNGSGKTSFLRALAGLPTPLRPASAEVDGTPPQDLPAPRLSRLVHLAPQDPRDGLAGLTVAGEFRLRGLALPNDLDRLADRDVATLSSGEARRVALAVASAGDPRILLLDEPAEGLDAAGREHLTNVVLRCARQGAVVVSDHTGWGARLATRTLELAPPPLAQPLAAIAVVVGPTVVEAPRTSVRRGSTELRLPAVRFGPGLHAVTGPVGAGKSTLLERLAGLRDGRGVTIQGARARPGENVRLLQPDAGRRLVAATVRDELSGFPDTWGFCTSLPGDRHPLALSSGEGQRVALAKALGRPAPLVLLDEPEAHLDGDGRARLLRALTDLVGRGACVVVATHDAGLLALAQGRVAVRP